MKALRPLLEYLAPLGLLPIPQDPPPGPVEELLGRYRAWLLVSRGVTPGTARGYVDCVRPFVAGRLHGGVLDLVGVTAGDVTGFVLGVCPGRAVGSAKLIVCALRSLLRWPHLTGAVPVSLAAAVPSVAGWRLSGLPKGLEPGQLRSLLAACDRRTPTGLRDYAIMLLLARLGLRAGEVARLGLDDVDSLVGHPRPTTRQVSGGGPPPQVPRRPGQPPGPLMPVWYYGTEEQKERFIRTACTDQSEEFIVGSPPANHPARRAVPRTSTPRRRAEPVYAGHRNPRR